MPQIRMLLKGSKIAAITATASKLGTIKTANDITQLIKDSNSMLEQAKAKLHIAGLIDGCTCRRQKQNR